MSGIWKILPLAALLAFGAPLNAQTTADDETADTGTPVQGDDGAPIDNGLNLGEEVTPNQGIGSSYVAGEFGDWEQRCVRTEDGSDPCQLYQLLRDTEGNPVSEMSIFPLPEGQQAAAGSTIITPLETLLTRQVTISVDGGTVKRYPFDFCAAQGCFARIGFTEAEILGFKRGNAGLMTIVPAAAPDRRIELIISLSGFTAGYDAVAASVAE